MTKYWCIYLTLVILFLSGCSKTVVPSQKEKFSFYGTLTDCVSAKVLPGMHVTVFGAAAGAPGLFGPTAVSYNLGDTYSDVNGNFKLTPLKQNGILGYNIFLDTSYGFLTNTPSITADSIRASSLTNYNLSFSINRYHYLKIYFSDSSLPSASDTLLIEVDCNGNNCGPGFNTFEVNSSPHITYFTSSGFIGNIQNGFAIFPVLGNSSVLVSYTKLSKSFKNTQRFVDLYCNANDTTYCKINY